VLRVLLLLLLLLLPPAPVGDGPLVVPRSSPKLTASVSDGSTPTKLAKLVCAFDGTSKVSVSESAEKREDASNLSLANVVKVVVSYSVVYVTVDSAWNVLQ
jgi:hypothetical protein